MVGLASPLAKPLARSLALPLTDPEGVGASAYAPFPAPAGYRWDFVTYDGVRVTYNGEPVVALVEA